MRLNPWKILLVWASALAASILISPGLKASNAHLNYPDWWKPVYETDIIQAPAPSHVDERERTFQDRNSPDSVRALAEAFFSQIDLNQVHLDPDYVRLDSWGRNESRWVPPPTPPPSIQDLLKSGHYQEALDAYRAFFFHRLLSPTPDYPIQPEHPLKRFFIEFIHQPNELLNQNVARFTMLDAKKQGAVVRVDIGAPGRVNWSFVPKQFHVYDDLIFPPEVNFMVACGKQPHFFDTLLAAYMDSGKKDYLEKWAAFQDDRHLNFAADADAAILPGFVPQAGAASSVTAGGSPAVGTLGLWLLVFNHLDYVAQRRPEIATELPSTTLARIIMDMWKAAPVGLRATRAASNNRSIEMYSEPFFLAALAFPEFHQASYYLRERIRTVELYPTVTMMPDGSDIENEVGYNHGYLKSAAKTRNTLLALPSIRPSQVDAKWIDDLDHNLALRVQFLLFLKLNNGWDFYPSHYRTSTDFTGANPMALSVAPAALVNPVAQQVISKEFGDGSGPEPPFRSVSWPYAGKYLLRSGWEKDAEVLYMQSPRPYSTSTWKNANDIQLFAFGQPLLTYATEGYGYTRGGFKGDGVISGWEEGFREHLREKYKNPDMHGLYQWEFTPVFVDECPQLGQETYAKLPENIRDDPTPMYGRGQEMAWQTPLENRWHESPRFTFAEGEYSGPFAKMDGSRFIYDVRHWRQVLLCREAGLWLVWDRLDSAAPHQYRLEWKFAQPFESDEKKQIPGFLPGQIHSENEGHILRTANPDSANLTIAMQSASQLAPAGTGVIFSNSGTVLSALYPRRTVATDLSEISPLNGATGQTGLRVRTPNGYQIEAQTTSSSAAAPAKLQVGDLEIEAESLVLVTAPDGRKYGIVLGSQSDTLAGTSIPDDVRDFEFELNGSTVTNIQPIYTPLERPTIEPAADRFADEVTVTIHHPVPGVELRYTLDGTDPTPASPLYTGAIKLQSTTIVRARAFRPGVKVLPATPDGTLVSVPLEADYIRREPLAATQEPATLKQGLAYTYFEGDSSLGAEPPAGISPTGQGEVKELLDTPVRSKDHGYLYVYTGFLNVPEDGVYSFHEPSEFVTPSVDAGYDLRLWMGNEEWYPTTGWHNYATWSVPLKKGLHPIRVAYVDWRNSGMPAFGVPWRGDHPILNISGPHLDLQPIPSAWFTH